MSRGLQRRGLPCTWSVGQQTASSHAQGACSMQLTAFVLRLLVYVAVAS